jgi:integrase
MATLKLILDKRTPKKDGTFPIRLYVYHNKTPHYITLGASLTERDYTEIFKRTPVGKRLEYRRSFEDFLNKAIDKYRSIKTFEINEFKRQLFEKTETEKQASTSLAEVFNSYVSSKSNKLALKSKIGYKTSLNSLLKFRPDCKLEEITISFLEEYEKWYEEAHPTKLNASVGIHLRNLRAVINKLKSDDSLPEGYKYPFGKGKYNIKSIIKPKQTLTQDEIKNLIELNIFTSSEERKARDLWLLQYYCNGVNLNDLIRIRWDNQVGNCFVIQRQKTKNTTLSRPIFIKIPIVDKLKVLIEKMGNRNSPYVLGFLREGMSESQIHEKKCKVASLMNAHLKEIGKRLNLSVELLSETARDAYATTLKRNGKSIEEIAEMLGHSSIVCTRNYLAQFEEEQIHLINESLP